MQHVAQRQRRRLPILSISSLKLPPQRFAHLIGNTDCLLRCVGVFSDQSIVSSAIVRRVVGLLTTQAQAEGIYVSLHAGATFPESADSVFDPGLPTQGTIVTEGDTGYRVGGALGYSFGRYFSVEGEYAYGENDLDTLNSNLIGVPLAATGTASAQTYMANAYLSLPTGAWRPYVGGGIGQAHVEADNAGFANVLVTADKTNDSDNAFAWQLMAGVGYQIAPNLELGARYRYLNIDEVTLISDAGDVQAVDEQRTHSVEAVLTWSWQREERVPAPLK